MKSLIIKIGRARVFIAIFCLFLASEGPLSQAGQDNTDNLDEVLRIINFLEEAAAYHETHGRFQGKKEEFSETQVAAFFDYLFSEGSSVFKSLGLKFFPNNKIEGQVVLNLKDQKLPFYIKDEINLYFAARIEINGRKVRLNFESLYLELQKIQPAAINAMIDLVAGSQGVEPQHLDQWYDLPKGIKKIETSSGRLIVHY
ncbi:MAG: hypothetical protein PHQ25_03060 [Acidobacteriota bacterium]|nr:hypothetical protein [Acidobacteriota bacterium]MDY0231768.1 hypothetical protein [Candidatus Saccharicenans sp.]